MKKLYIIMFSLISMLCLFLVGLFFSLTIPSPGYVQAAYTAAFTPQGINVAINYDGIPFPTPANYANLFTGIENYHYISGSPYVLGFSSSRYPGTTYQMYYDRIMAYSRVLDPFDPFNNCKEHEKRICSQQYNNTNLGFCYESPITTMFAIYTGAGIYYTTKHTAHAYTHILMKGKTFTVYPNQISSGPSIQLTPNGHTFNGNYINPDKPVFTPKICSGTPLEGNFSAYPGEGDD